MKALLDTNIIIDAINGRNDAKVVLGSYDPHISILTYIEVLAGIDKHGHGDAVKQGLSAFTILGLDKPIGELAAKVRTEKKLKLPDAIIYATAKEHGILLITRDTKSFSKDDPQIRVPYI